MDDGSDALRRVTVLLVKKMEMEETCRISRTLNTLSVEYDSSRARSQPRQDGRHRMTPHTRQTEARLSIRSHV
jgi:hypothetical protein